MTRLGLPAVFLTACISCGAATAGLLDDPNWQEGAVPPPPAFSVERLLRFEVNPNSAMVYGIDPQTLSISSEDRVVRYVVVASSPSGGRNVLYEGIRCATAEVRTYARHNGQQWVLANDPPWQPMIARASRHALQLARQGACDNAGTPLRTEDVVRALTQPARYRGN
jgi:hypothetical protein